MSIVYASRSRALAPARRFIQAAPPPPPPPPPTGPTPTPWVRPADWPAISVPIATEQRFVGVHAVFNDGSNFVALSASGAYTVDWGDGTVQNIAAGVTAQHVYSFSNVNLSPVTERGFRCAVVTVTPQAGQNLTALNLHLRHNQTGLGVYVSGFLDIAVSGPHLSDFRLAVAAPGEGVQNINFNALERVNIVNSIVTTPSQMFLSCRKLRQVDAVVLAASVTNFNQMFQGCTSLQTIPLLNTAAGTNFSNMFQNCLSLKSVPALNVGAGSSAANLNNMFNSCSSLSNIDAHGFRFSFSVAGCKLSAAALDKLYGNLAVTTGQTITVTTNHGTATDNPAIATGRGWTVTGS